MKNKKNEKEHESKFKNENLVFLDTGRFNSNFLSVTYIINKKDTCISALKTYLDLLVKRSLIYGSEQKLLNKLEKDLKGSKLTYKLYQLDFNYVLNISIKSVQNNFIKGFRNLQLECARFIDNWVKNSYNGDTNYFKEVVKRNVEEVRKLDTNDSFILDKAINLNFLSNMSYGLYPYGKTEEFLALKDIDLSSVTKAIKDAQVFINYVGNCDATTLAYVHETYKPTPLIQSVRSGDFFIRDDVLLKTHESVANNLLGIVFTLDSYSTVKTTIIAEIIRNYISYILTKNSNVEYLLPKDFSLESLYKGNIMIYKAVLNDDVNEDEVNELVKKYVLNISDRLLEDDLKVVVNKLKIRYLEIYDDVYKYDDFISRCKLLSLSTDIDKYISMFDEITIDDIRKKMNLIKCVGSIYLEK